MRNRFDFLEMINGIEMMKAGTRFTNTMKEMQEHMDKKEKNNAYMYRVGQRL